MNPATKPEYADTANADKKPKNGRFVCFFNKFTILPLYFLSPTTTTATAKAAA